MVPTVTRIRKNKILVATTRAEVAEVSLELQRQQKQRNAIMNSRIRIHNRLKAVVAGGMGYENNLTKAQRIKLFKKASELIDAVVAGDQDHPLKDLIMTMMRAVSECDILEDNVRKTMENVARKLPTANWSEEPEQRGFGIFSLAKLIGETGDLYNYDDYRKACKRMGCSPWHHNGECHMGSTWRRLKSLPGSQWTEFGYSPSRRSQMFNIVEALYRTNGEGEYRTHYLEVKEEARKRYPEWFQCSCDGTGKNVSGGECHECQGKGEKRMHAHLHAHLMVARLIIKRTWQAWRRLGQGLI